ncbi:sugar phosphate isomerase/epimerase family protein [Thermodesulfobacterium hydrogeniphilum]|uniref:sugar phosphate isomerase/epimerase family protein n=1 Tax=Thermodesulfobacterium hydrogeniphilum TaxID=161156 RepID=UPI00056FE6B4|nr:sugar phosphate isomerase/epimerase [Thermodesulfobacterium hydrogeniphilum]
MSELVFVSVPFNLLVEKYLSHIFKNRINVEIALNTESLDNYSYKFFRKIAQELKEEGLKITIHLPFMDLSIGALDPWIKEASLRRIIFAIERVVIFEPLNMVLHSGYHADYHREKKSEWRESFIEGLSKILEICKDFNLTLSLENTFEPDPEFIKPVFETFQGELFWCFDPAHAKVFSEKDELEWLKTLYPYLKEIHCHDNLGKYDDHLAIGKGNVKFKEIFEFLREKNIKPILTSEAHNEEDTYINLKFLKSIF